MNERPIGAFDSGVGGLSVLREIRALLPAEDLLYVADSAYVPYGEKSPGFVEARSVALTEFLLQQGAKAVVVACNTATTVAVTALRARFALPIVGMEPAVKPATRATRSGRVGVLATSGTVASAKFADLLARFGEAADVRVQPCPGLVECVERGALSDSATRTLVEQYVHPLTRAGIDTLVLGCTHYPFLRALIAEVAGAGVNVIDPNAAVARQLERRLSESGLRAPATRRGAETFWSSGDPSTAKRVFARLWGVEVDIMPLPALAPTEAQLPSHSETR